jgi:hypothetical protein
MSTDLIAPESGDPRKLVGVVARQITPDMQRLLAALELAFPVHFEHVALLDRGRFAGVVEIDAASPSDMPGPVPRLVLCSGAPVAGAETPVCLSEDSSLARPLRKATISEETMAGTPSPALPSSARVLASVQGKPVWWQIGAARESLCVSAYPLAELREGETLRDHLRAGCFMTLLPLLHFIGRLLGDQSPTLPPLRASVVIDDPNLHWPSYGFLDYRKLVKHAAEHNYHVAFATVPLDGWLVNRRAASLIRGNPAALSLLMHGNDHIARELGRLNNRDAEPVIAQGLRRIATLERRSGISVDRVMAPPHGACSEAALRAMFSLGLEAACISRPYPWRESFPAPTPLAGWHPAEMVAGGLPVLLRYALSLPREDLVFRALLGQPLILYGHHQDFSDGLDLLAQAAGEVNRLGDVQWGSLGWIARGNYTTRIAGDTLHVGMHSRRVSIEVPAGVRTLRVQAPEPFDGPAWHELACADTVTAMRFRAGLGKSEVGPIEGPAKLELTLRADRPLDPTSVAARRFRAWPPLRRALVEGRDRMQPLLSGRSRSQAQSRKER